MNRYICIHGHFYQPPRENPWLEEIEIQDSAYPYSDWNDRITEECYSPNRASRIVDAEGTIIDMSNNYSKINFNFGPTLLSWMEKHRPDDYKAVIEADKRSMSYFSGHGSALAQVYNHMIMPLANPKDKETQVIWGIRDFVHRFGRAPEGMWLPETAVDIKTLEALANKGIKFTILAQRQAGRVRSVEAAGEWRKVKDGKVDPKIPYICNLPSGKSIVLFFYDGPIAHEVSFGNLLTNGEYLAQRLYAAFSQARDHAQIVHIATDGETFGHHRRFGDMALAYCLHLIQSQGRAKLTNYSEFLEMHPPAYEAEIIENSSWSCVHGIERWRNDCGCNSGMNGDWRQKWRKPLREALDRLRDRLIQIYEKEGAKYLRDPWEARNDYVDVILDRGNENIDRFLAKHARKALTSDEKIKALEILEIQRNAMLMYTSCGWFFDDISGPEAVQVMEYAARAIQLAAASTNEPLENEFLGSLEAAPSNIDRYENGRKVFEMFVEPSRIDLPRVAGHYAVSSLFEPLEGQPGIYCYSSKRDVYEQVKAGRLKLAAGIVRIQSEITLEAQRFIFGAIYLGDHNINAGVREFTDEASFSAMRDEIMAEFQKGNVPEIIRLMDSHFAGNTYSIWHLFRNEQRKILNKLLLPTYENIEASYRRIYEDNLMIMNFLRHLNIPLAPSLQETAEHVINYDFMRAYNEQWDLERTEKLVQESLMWNVTIHPDTIRFIENTWITRLFEQLKEDPHDVGLLEKIRNILNVFSPLSPHLNPWKAQNICFSVSRELYEEKRASAGDGNEASGRWIDLYNEIGRHLKVRVSG